MTAHENGTSNEKERSDAPLFLCLRPSGFRPFGVFFSAPGRQSFHRTNTKLKRLFVNWFYGFTTGFLGAKMPEYVHGTAYFATLDSHI